MSSKESRRTGRGGPALLALPAWGVEHRTDKSRHGLDSSAAPPSHSLQGPGQLQLLGAQSGFVEPENEGVKAQGIRARVLIGSAQRSQRAAKSASSPFLAPPGQLQLRIPAPKGLPA